MREIKFRAWDRRRSKMIQPNNGDFIGWHAMSNWKDCLEVMQWTGLTDKNGKEIYQCDIVRILYTDWPSQPQESNGRYAMSLEDYKKSISKVGFVEWNDEDAEYLIGFGDCNGSITPGRHGEIEVIGNIFENPELIDAPSRPKA